MSSPSFPRQQPFRRARALVLTAAALLALAAAPLPAHGQADFKVTYQVERTDAQRVQLSGRVYNGATVDAVDVYVTVEAVNASGKVVARGIAFVAPAIPSRSAADFSARVPNVAGTTGFRVGVSSFRLGLGRSESP